MKIKSHFDTPAIFHLKQYPPGSLRVSNQLADFLSWIKELSYMYIDILFFYNEP